MCIVIHKPAGAEISAALIRAAVARNTDGWGLMGYRPDGSPVIERGLAVDAAAIGERLAEHRDSELALHLRRRTHGAVSTANLHPFEITPGLYLMHNGSFQLPLSDSVHSDTWHVVHDILRPLAENHRGLLVDPAFEALLSSLVSADNRLVLFDAASAVFRIVNRGAGVEHEGLWISNTRWLDTALFPLAAPVSPLRIVARAA